MKHTSILFALFLFLFTACEEIPPVISPIVDFGECPVANASEVAAQQRNRATVIQSVINIFRVGIRHTEKASRPGNVRLPGLDLNPHDFGDGFSHFRTGRHAGIG